MLLIHLFALCINELLTVVMLPGLLPIPVIVFEYFPRLFNKTENCFLKLFFHFDCRDWMSFLRPFPFVTFLVSKVQHIG